MWDWEGTVTVRPAPCQHRALARSSPWGKFCCSLFFCLRGVPVGVVYGGNNQRFKCLTGRCDHRTPLTITMPAQSWLILHYFFCFRSATSDTGPNCQANNSHWDIHMDGSRGESYLKPGHCTHVWLPLRFSASYFGN